MSKTAGSLFAHGQPNLSKLKMCGSINVLSSGASTELHTQNSVQATNLTRNPVCKNIWHRNTGALENDVKLCDARLVSSLATPAADQKEGNKTLRRLRKKQHSEWTIAVLHRQLQLCPETLATFLRTITYRKRLFILIALKQKILLLSCLYYCNPRKLNPVLPLPLLAEPERQRRS